MLWRVSSAQQHRALVKTLCLSLSAQQRALCADCTFLGEQWKEGKASGRAAVPGPVLLGLHHPFRHETAPSCWAHRAGSLPRASTLKPRPLDMPAFRYVFPIPEAVLRLDVHTQLHEAALGVLGAHVTPWDPLVPREAALSVLLHALGVVPAFRHASCLQHAIGQTVPAALRLPGVGGGAAR